MICWCMLRITTSSCLRQEGRYRSEGKKGSGGKQYGRLQERWRQTGSLGNDSTPTPVLATHAWMLRIACTCAGKNIHSARGRRARPPWLPSAAERVLRECDGPAREA